MILLNSPEIFSMVDDNVDLAGKLIYYDTSVILEMVGLSSNPERQQEVYNFHNRIATEGAISVSSAKVWEEMHIAMTGSFVRRAKSFPKERKKSVIRRNPGIMTEVSDSVRTAYEAFKADSNHIISDCVVTMEDIEHINLMMHQCDISFTDAVHYFNACKEGVDYLATLDGDFNIIPNPSVRIITDSGNYIKYTQKNVDKVLRSGF